MRGSTAMNIRFSLAQVDFAHSRRQQPHTDVHCSSYETITTAMTVCESKPDGRGADVSPRTLLPSE